MKFYLALLFLTLFAFLSGWLEAINSIVIASILVTTFIKGQIIIDYFMGLKDVKFKYRMLPAVWLLFVLFMIGVAYYM